VVVVAVAVAVAAVGAVMMTVAALPASAERRSVSTPAV
jgi:hypothetical protein